MLSLVFPKKVPFVILLTVSHLSWKSFTTVSSSVGINNVWWFLVHQTLVMRTLILICFCDCNIFWTPCLINSSLTASNLNDSLMPITTSNGVSLIVVITLELAPLIKSVSLVKEDCGPSSAKKKWVNPRFKVIPHLLMSSLYLEQCCDVTLLSLNASLSALWTSMVSCKKY